MRDTKICMRLGSNEVCLLILMQAELPSPSAYALVLEEEGAGVNRPRHKIACYANTLPLCYGSNV